MMKNPREIALNHLHVALRKAADQHHSAIGLSESPELTALFRDLAAERELMAERLEEEIRKIGLPQMPHAEREGLEKLATQVKAAISSDSRSVLVEGAKSLEREIAATCAGALQEDLPEPTRLLVDEIGRRVLDSQARLSSIATEPPP